MKSLQQLSASLAVLFLMNTLSTEALAQVSIRPQPYIPPPFDTSVPVPGGGTEYIYVQTPRFTPANRPLILVFHGAYYDNHWGNGTPNLNAELESP